MVRLESISVDRVTFGVPDEIDLERLCLFMREDDENEIVANSGGDPFDVLKYGMEVSEVCQAIYLDGNPIFIFGALSDGCIWAVGTDEIEDIWRPFLRHSKTVVNQLQADYPILYNCVDARNLVHIRWLKWLGFKFIKKHERYGVAEIPFWEFVRI